MATHPLAAWWPLDKWRRIQLGDLLAYCCPLCSALTEEPYNHRQWHEREGQWWKAE